MKLPDSEPLAQEDYFLIADTWRQEWERGVQVPVNDIAVRSVDLRYGLLFPILKVLKITLNV